MADIYPVAPALTQPGRIQVPNLPIPQAAPVDTSAIFEGARLKLAAQQQQIQQQQFDQEMQYRQDHMNQVELPSLDLQRQKLQQDIATQEMDNVYKTTTLLAGARAQTDSLFNMLLLSKNDQAKMAQLRSKNQLDDKSIESLLSNANSPEQKIKAYGELNRRMSQASASPEYMDLAISSAKDQMIIDPQYKDAYTSLTPEGVTYLQQNLEQFYATGDTRYRDNITPERMRAYQQTAAGSSRNLTTDEGRYKTALDAYNAGIFSEEDMRLYLLSGGDLTDTQMQIANQGKSFGGGAGAPADMFDKDGTIKKDYVDRYAATPSFANGITAESIQNDMSSLMNTSGALPKVKFEIQSINNDGKNSTGYGTVYVDTDSKDPELARKIGDKLGSVPQWDASANRYVFKNVKMDEPISAPPVTVNGGAPGTNAPGSPFVYDASKQTAYVKTIDGSKMPLLTRGPNAGPVTKWSEAYQAETGESNLVQIAFNRPGGLQVEAIPVGETGRYFSPDGFLLGESFGSVESHYQDEMNIGQRDNTLAIGNQQFIWSIHKDAMEKSMDLSSIAEKAYTDEEALTEFKSMLAAQGDHKFAMTTFSYDKETGKLTNPSKMKDLKSFIYFSKNQPAQAKYFEYYAFSYLVPEVARLRADVPRAAEYDDYELAYLLHHEGTYDNVKHLLGTGKVVDMKGRETDANTLVTQRDRLRRYERKMGIQGLDLSNAEFTNPGVATYKWVNGKILKFDLRSNLSGPTTAQEPSVLPGQVISKEQFTEEFKKVPYGSIYER